MARVRRKVELVSWDLGRTRGIGIIIMLFKSVLVLPRMLYLVVMMRRRVIQNWKMIERVLDLKLTIRLHIMHNH
jgi:hypothetical protein